VIPEPELRDIAGVLEDEALVLDQRDEKDTVLGPNDKLELGKKGTEHLRTIKRVVTVFFDCEPKTIAAGTYTTEELIRIFKVQAGYLLNLVNDEGQLVTLKPGQRVRLREGMKFFTQVPCGGSS